MNRLLSAIVVAIATGATGCADEEPRVLPPFGQLVVHVDTDAPLPAAPGKRLGADDAPALFDRVRIEVFRSGEDSPCVDCTHEFDLDREIVAAHRASVGITPPVGATGYRARVRLFSARFVQAGQPRRDATVDVTVALPSIGHEGHVVVTVPLRTVDVGKSIGSLAEPVPAEPGPPKPGFSGSWPSARRVFCRGSAGPDEVCIPGGAYWMGNPLNTFNGVAAQATFRIVALAPFFLDKREVTVGDFRASGLAKYRDPLIYEANPSIPGVVARCTYTEKLGNSENLPVTCLSWDKASAYCAGRGADLPSNAQFEYAAGGLEGRLFLWGDEAPSCGDAVYARGYNFMRPLSLCAGAWLEPAGAGTKDRLDLRSGTVLDLAGNVAELLRDRWNPLDGPCWGTGVFYNPVCDIRSTMPDLAEARTIAGGSWAGDALSTAASARGPAMEFAKIVNDTMLRRQFDAYLAGVGFRCARADD